MMTIPERIKLARLAKGYTQRQLGELLEYEGRGATTAIQKWEYGENPVPITKLRKLAEILEVPLDSLIP